MYVRERAQHDPVERPVHHVHAAQIPRSDDEIELVQCGGEAREKRGIVGQVGVHLTNRIGVRLERSPQSIDIRAAEPTLAGAMHHLDAARIARDQSSASWPVPSGELSSTTSRRAGGNARSLPRRVRD
jgi:hypothetical protein